MGCMPRSDSFVANLDVFLLVFWNFLSVISVLKFCPSLSLQYLTVVLKEPPTVIKVHKIQPILKVPVSNPLK